MSARLIDGILFVATAIALATWSRDADADHSGRSPGLGSHWPCVDATGETTNRADDGCPTTIVAASRVASKSAGRGAYALKVVVDDAATTPGLDIATAECVLDPATAADDGAQAAAQRYEADAIPTEHGVNVTCKTPSSLAATTYRVNVTVRTAHGRHVWLRPDDLADEYVAVYEDARCAVPRHEHCEGCAWTDAADGSARYVACAPNDGECPARRHGRANADGSVDVKCPELNVTAVEPSTGPLAGGTRLSVTVAAAAWGYGDGRVNVTVDGRPCADAHRRDNVTVTCTVPAAAPGARAAAAAAVVVHLDDVLRLTWEGRYKYANTSAAVAVLDSTTAAACPVRFVLSSSLSSLLSVAVVVANARPAIQ